MISHDITSLDQLRDFAVGVLSSINPHDGQAFTITLSGDLAAGKTTFTQKLGELLGIEKDEINSPTYVIEQRYPLDTHESFSELVHIDAYRLELDGDPIKIGLNHTLKDPTKLVVIEWPEKIEKFLQDYKKMEITLSLEGDKRIAQVK